jgi:hypothetical protein
MKKAIGGKKIGIVFVLIVFCIFAMSVLIVLMLGAGTYRNVTDISRDGQDERTVLSYIWAKIKNSDDAGKVYVGVYYGSPALFIDEEFSGISFSTVVYHYDGWVYEIFSETGLDLYPSDGERVIRIDDLVFEEYEHGLIKVSVGTSSLLVSPRSGPDMVRPGF